MTTVDFKELFTAEVLTELFPENRTNDFFEALFGDTEEGAYNISLQFAGQGQDRLDFEFHLNQRPGQCLACNLTYGLPEVFSRHPIINVKGVVAKIEEKLGGGIRCSAWELGATREHSRERHTIPLTITLG